MMIAKKTTLAIVVLMFMASLSLLLGKASFETGSQRQIRIACVGDSITEGAYPEKLDAMLGANYEVGNFGVSGSTVLAKSEMPYTRQSAFLKGKAFQPSIVIIMLGTNDAQEETYGLIQDFSQDYKELISEYQSLETNPEVWLVTPPPVFANDMGISNTNLEEGVIPRIEQIAAELDLPLIDVNTVLAEHPEYFGDGVHPDNEGLRIIANEIGQALSFGDNSAGEC